MAETVVRNALEAGILGSSDAEKISPDQLWALRFMTALAQTRNFHDPRAGSEDVSSMRSEIGLLNEMIGEDSGEDRAEILIPPSLAPFMKGVVLPILRKVVERGS